MQCECLIHNIEFTVKNNDGTYLGSDKFLPQCPICLVEENKLLKEKLKLVTEQRDTLLGAIKVINTVKNNY
jgi:hypothetical protein